MKTISFSVLLSVYSKEEPCFLASALESIWDLQTVKPLEIVIVKDGPLTPELDKVINAFQENAPCQIVSLEKNQGLGVALGCGVIHCKNEYIARMDSDDIALPDRFEKQMVFMSSHPEIDICGGMIQEFSESPDRSIGLRVLPEEADAIYSFMKFRNPFNHMTVCFKKGVILKAGNYQTLHGYEDYWLWARVLQAGGKGANLPDILVYARTGNNMLARRRGWKLCKSEIELARRLHKIGVLSFPEMLRNIILKSGVRLLPALILKLMYKHLRKRNM